LVTVSLPEKLYFYHSAAECFFAGSLALKLGYFVWIFNSGPNKFFIIGVGYVFGVGSILLFFASSILMALDDIMKSCRTSILYTHEMASVNSSVPQKPAPAVSKAAQAFASAKSSNGGAGNSQKTANNKIANNNNNNIGNNKIGNNNNSKIGDNDQKMLEGVRQGPYASTGSEMVTETKTDREAESQRVAG